MTIKSKKQRHKRFLAAGFFPPEMPSCFYSETLSLQRDSLLREYEKIPKKKGGVADFMYYKSSRSMVNFPRFGKQDRRHSYINPVSFFFLSKVLSDNYLNLRKLNRQSKLSVAPSIFDWGGSRALIPPVFGTRGSHYSSINARYELLAETDISEYYHSIYTHSIAWAIHTKKTAKLKPKDYTMYGNVIDLLARNSQDGQTIGIPVGPDTSRLIAEIVGSAIDREIQKSLRRNKGAISSTQRSAMRFVDDFSFGCNTQQDAERAISVVRNAVNMYELDLNNEKTAIRRTGPDNFSGWKSYLLDFLPEQGNLSPSRWERYFYMVHVVAKENPHADVFKYAIRSANRLMMASSNWGMLEDFLISSYRNNPTVLSDVVDAVIFRHLLKKDAATNMLRDFINSRIVTLSSLNKTGELIYLLFLAISINIKIKEESATALVKIENGAIATLLSDAIRIGVVEGKIEADEWKSSLSVEGLDGPMWLYVYENARQNMDGKSNQSYVKSHNYFKHMLSLDVAFYRTGAFHYNSHEALRRFKLDMVRRRLLEKSLEADLGESMDDFDPNIDEEDDAEDEGYV